MGVKSIAGGTVVTMDPDRRIIENGVVVIEDRHIAGVGYASDVVVPNGAEIIDASGMAVLPGLINCHTHVPQILLRGYAANEGRRVWDWLTNVVHPGLAAYELSDIRTAARLYCVEAIRSGMTCFVDNEDAWPGQTMDALGQVIASYSEAGVRAMVARMMCDEKPDQVRDLIHSLQNKEPQVIHTDNWGPTDRLLSDLEQLIKTYNGSSGGRIQVWPAPVGTLICSERMLRTSRHLARQNQTMWTLHLVQGPAGVENPGPSSTEFLHHGGHLDHRLLAAHCVGLGQRDIQLLKDADVKGCTQVVSNCFLAMGMAPVPEILEAGLTLAVGTDDVNCNGTVNLLSDMKTLALVHRALADDPSSLTAEQVLEMATINGARAVGMRSEIGSIETGKRADVILIDLGHAQMTPAHHLPSAIVFQTYGNEVDTVIIDGNIVMRNREDDLAHGRRGAQSLPGRRRTIGGDQHPGRNPDAPTVGVRARWPFLDE